MAIEAVSVGWRELASCCRVPYENIEACECIVADVGTAMMKWKSSDGRPTLKREVMHLMDMLKLVQSDECLDACVLCEGYDDVRMCSICMIPCHQKCRDAIEYRPALVPPPRLTRKLSWLQSGEAASSSSPPGARGACSHCNRWLNSS